MFEGKFIRWGRWAPGSDLAGQASVELLQKNFTTDELSRCIQELVAVRDRMMMIDRKDRP